MTTCTRRIVSFIIFICCLNQLWAFQVPSRRSKIRDFEQFRVPRAQKLLQYMNDSVDPCVDFYEFACGNWQNENAATEDIPLTSPMENLQASINKELQDLLLEKVTRHDGNVGRKVKEFFASCMNADEASKTVRQVFKEFLKRNPGMYADERGWNERSYNWLIQVSNMRKLYGMDIIIGLNIRPDYQTRQDSRIYIGEASTVSPRSLCKEGEFVNSQWDDLQTEVMDNMAFWFDMGKTESKRFAMDIFDFEVKLCRGMSGEESLDVPSNYPRKSLAELDQLFKNIEFSYFVTASMGQPIPMTVNLVNEDYFNNLSKTLTTTPKRTIANYIMYRSLQALSFPEEPDAEKRTPICIEKCMEHFPKVIGEMYHRKNFLSEKNEDIESLWTKLREAFKVNIGSQLWIEETTRRKAIYKIAAMQFKFPFYQKDVLENEYGSLRIDKGNLWRNIQNILELEQKNEVKKLYNSGMARTSDDEVEAADIDVGYNPSQNIIVMPLGLLQPPFYHRTAPNSYKYGVLGYLIARELVHGFDEIGWNYDESAAMRFWWDHNSTLEYKERVQCFRDQYVGYAGEDASLPLSELDEKVRRIVAENGALNITFNAYLSWLEETNEPQVLYDETLSDVNYSNTQLLFISFAQSLCTSTYSETAPIGLFPWDVANRLEKFQVNGVLWNMKEFSREFNCLPGTDMNPGNNCEIY